MNRNVESHFSKLPRADIQRSVFDRSHSLKTSFNAGQLIPILCEEILPGDTVKLNTNKVIRLQTMLTPILDNLYAETYYFFCPNRILWKHWKEFCGENSESAWVPSTVYTEPKIGSPAGGFAVGTIADYLGLPVNVEIDNNSELAPSALPFRAYAKICNEWFRDQNLLDPLLIPDDDAYQEGSNGWNFITDIANGGRPFIASKFHDYFTSCLPAPQKGPPIGIPIDVPQFNGGTFPVTTVNQFNAATNFVPLAFNVGSKITLPAEATSPIGVTGTRQSTDFLFTNRGNNTNVEVADSSSPVQSPLAPANLAVTIPDQNGGAGSQVSFSVNELRLAFATQRFLEKLAYGGSRYTELLRTLFGVVSPDASLQRPEYLGGSRIPLNVSEVTNNAQTEKEYLGDLGGMSRTADSHYDFTKSFTEHGWLIGVCVVRYKHTYCQGIPKKFLRTSFLDYYQPTFANLGNMPVYSAEIYADGNLENGRSKVFGYQEAWAEYRYSEDRCSGEMRPGVPNSLASWHLADNYDTSPTLSPYWIVEDLNNVDRVLAVTSQVANQIFGDFYFDIEHTRPMPMYSIPGLIDHF